MQAYKFEKMYSRMQKEYGTISPNQISRYSDLLYPIESNVLKVHRQDAACTSRQFQKAILLCLFDLQEQIDGRHENLDDFRNEQTEKLEHAIRMAFDPLINPEVAAVLGPLETREKKKSYYALFIRCLIRIYDSVDFWNNQYGSNGYFKYIESQIGVMVKGDQFHYAIPALKTS